MIYGFRLHETRCDLPVFPPEGPGYFATFLDSHSIPWQLVKIDAGETLPPMPITLVAWYSWVDR